MKLLKSLTLSGYMGVSDAEDKKLCLDFADGITFLIGPNNSGKSIPHRFLHFAIPKLAASHFPVGGLDDEEFGRYDVWGAPASGSVVAELTFNVTSRIPEALTNELDVIAAPGSTEIKTRAIVFRPDSQWQMLSCPWVKSTWYEGWLYGVDNVGTVTSPRKDGAMQKMERKSDVEQKYQKLIGPTVNGRFHFFDAVRATDRKGQRAMSDGSGVLQDLWEWQKDRDRAIEWRDFRRRLIESLNSIFKGAAVPAISELEMKSEVRKSRGGTFDPAMQIVFDQSRNLPVNLEDMGTGISQLVIILSALLKLNRFPSIFLIEEPETNLHPGLLRRFIEVIRGFNDVQFVITTHSSVLLDCISDSDLVYHFRQGKECACFARKCELRSEQHAILDSLGVSAGALLQSNAVIWVEGPSDRLYLHTWIAAADPDLREGSDYEFGLYGGKLLAHLSLEQDEEAAEQFIPLLNLCRFSVVIMDRDLPVGTPDDKLRTTKLRILGESKKDEKHRRAIVTIGREIENDIPIEALLMGAAAVIGRPYDDLQGAAISGKDPYEDEILAHLKLEGDAAKALRRKLGNKVELAQCALAAAKTAKIELTPPTYVTGIVELIRRARALEA